MLFNPQFIIFRAYILLKKIKGTSHYIIITYTINKVIALFVAPCNLITSSRNFSGKLAFLQGRKNCYTDHNVLCCNRTWIGDKKQARITLVYEQMHSFIKLCDLPWVTCASCTLPVDDACSGSGYPGLPVRIFSHPSSRAIFRAWTSLGDSCSPWIPFPRMSQTCSVGFKSGERDGGSMHSIPPSSM